DPTSTLSVRLARVQGAASTVATVTQSEALWQVAIARVALDGSGLPTSITDVRRFVNQVMSWRQGSNAADWSDPGTTNYLVGNVEMMSGSAIGLISAGTSSALLNVTFPKTFSIPPLVIGTVVSVGASSQATVVDNQTESASSVSWVARTADGTNVSSNTTFVVNWLAIGQR
ncbi:MAG: hypothetical protein KDD89_09555, partial [Anaerolineales bacterium]|nr:hypothetical protein [Anaerolineales bacterium]